MSGKPDMMIAAILINLILLPTAFIHVLWAFGILWPAKDEQSLINTVVGHPDVNKFPSRSLTLVVAAGIAAAGGVALWSANLFTLPFPGWVQTSGVIVLSLVFGLRGLSSYVMDGPLGKRVEPFATLDRRYFAPLCLALCACFVVLASGSF